MLWGQAVLNTMEDTIRLTSGNTAVEASFMAPGLGPWRPGMAPYVDEQIGMGGAADPGGLIGLGLEWHPKMLWRFEQASTPINPYQTRMNWISNETEISYWLGGLITGGIAPQFDENTGIITQWDVIISRWLGAHATWGQSITSYIKSKWRNVWIRDVFWSQHLGCWGQNTSRIQHKEF